MRRVWGVIASFYEARMRDFHSQPVPDPLINSFNWIAWTNLVLSLHWVQSQSGVATWAMHMKDPQLPGKLLLSTFLLLWGALSCIITLNWCFKGVIILYHFATRLEKREERVTADSIITRTVASLKSLLTGKRRRKGCKC